MYDKIIEDNMGLVYSIVNKYKTHEVEKDDLVQEGIIALIVAAKKYNKQKASFFTYAYFWVWQAIDNNIKKNRRMMYVPHNFKDEEEFILTPYEVLLTKQIKQQLHEQLQGLTQREKQVILLRFGLQSEPQTLHQVGALINLSHEGVRKIEKKALNKLELLGEV